MCDVLRTIHQFTKFDQLTIRMIEASPSMKYLQQQNLLKYFLQDQKIELTYNDKNQNLYDLENKKVEITWHDSLLRLPLNKQLLETPFLLIAHEFFDALPVYKFQFDGLVWREIQVGLNSGNKLRLQISEGENENIGKVLMPEKFPPDLKFAQGQQIEISPAQIDVIKDICQLIMMRKGASLIIDYGDNHAFTDSIQGISEHRLIEQEE